MNGQRRTHQHVWILLAAIALIAAHGAFFYFTSSHITLSAATLSGVILLVVIKVIVIKRRKVVSKLDGA
jgi:hypothetical protein